MKPITNKFFPRGGFSSSQWNHTEQIKNIVNSLYENELILQDLDLFTSQNKSRNQKNMWRLSS